MTVNTLNEPINIPVADANITEQSSSDESEQISEQEEVESDGENEQDQNSGWANSISKILKTNKPKKKKSLVLSKAKVLNQKKATEKEVPAGYELARPDGEVVAEKIKITQEEETKPESKKRKKTDPKVRKKPNILDKDRERLLAKVATKGVVQLFNAVRAQQNEIRDKLSEAGPLEVKKDKALKSIDKDSFMSNLMGEKASSVKNSASLMDKTKKETSTWNVFREDFMMGAKMKDWDKEVEEETDLQMETE